jgi:hypothetical protein
MNHLDKKTHGAKRTAYSCIYDAQTGIRIFLEETACNWKKGFMPIFGRIPTRIIATPMSSGET